MKINDNVFVNILCIITEITNKRTNSKLTKQMFMFVSSDALNLHIYS